MGLGPIISRYLIALAATGIAYGLYGSLIAPIIEGTPQPVIPKTPEHINSRPGLEIRSEIRSLFPKDAWEVNPCKILETRQGKILFQDYYPRDDGSVELKPLSMVIQPSAPKDHSGGSQTPPPIVLRAPEGAVLRFDNPLTLTGEIGKLQRGQLNGEVQIYRKASSTEKDDSFSLVTQNIQISSERIFTLYETSFRFGKSYGRGKHLAIDLAGPTQIPDGRTTFAGIQRIELARVDELYLHRESKSSADGDLLGDTNRSLNIKCQGPFVFDFEKRTATFKKQVIVQSADGAGDQLACQSLAVHFHTGQSHQVSAETKDEKKQQFEIGKLVATGSPAVLTSISQNAQASADLLEYNLRSNYAVFKSSRSVTMTRDYQRIDAPEIRYSFGSEGRLGEASIAGPGSLVQQPSQQREGFVCQWENQLTLQNENDKKVLSIDNATISMGDTQLTAQILNLWLWEIPKLADDGKTRWAFAPSKMYAEGQVKIIAPRIEGDCAQAAAFWPNPTDSRKAHNTPTIRVVVKPVGRRGYTNTVPVYQVESVRPQEGAALNPLPDQPLPKRVRFVGRQVQLQMRGGDDFGSIDELTVNGEVVVQQFEIANRVENATLEIRGDKLRAISAPEELYRLFVAGVDSQFATVASRGLRLAGNKIHLDQSSNRLWIEGQGEMHMRPVENEHSQPLGNTGDTHVNWDGGMVFDGQQIYFETNVKSDSRQFDDLEKTSTVTTTESTALSITLNNRVDFRNSSQEFDQSAMKVESMVMVGGLNKDEAAFPNTFQSTGRTDIFVVSSQYDVDRQLIANHEIRSPRATFNVDSGMIGCTGIGYLRIRQLAGTTTGKAPADQRQSILPASDAAASPIDYVKIDFENSMRGNLETKELTFEGNVRSHYDGIDNFNEIPQQRNIRRKDGRGMILDCDQLVVARWTPRSSDQPVVEMIATGNAKVKGSQFEGTAERISYNESKNLVVIEAPVRGNAEFWFQDPGRSKRGHLIARKVIYNLTGRTYQVQEMKQVDFSQDEPIRDK